MNNKKQIDLHIHTNESDGTWGLDQLIDKVIINNLTYFSITDHDSFEYVKKMSNKVFPEKYKFIPGVEISSTYLNKEFHVLAYNFDINNKKLNLLLRDNLKIREIFNTQIILFLEKKYNLDLINEYNEYSNDRSRGGWKSLNFLIDNNLIQDLNNFFEEIIEIDEKMIFPDPSSVIKVIKQANGYSFLAHPASYHNGKLLDINILDYFKKIGIDGIEVYSPYLREFKDSKYYIQYCKDNNLMFSAGSDCHGEFIKERSLGKPKVFLKDVSIDKLIR